VGTTDPYYKFIQRTADLHAYNYVYGDSGNVNCPWQLRNPGCIFGEYNTITRGNMAIELVEAGCRRR
jgi:hypothetical protein